MSATITPEMLNSASSRPATYARLLSGNAAPNAQLKPMSFAGEGQQLPVDGFNVGKQTPITRDSGARDQRLQQRGRSTRQMESGSLRDRLYFSEQIHLSFPYSLMRLDQDHFPMHFLLV